MGDSLIQAQCDVGTSSFRATIEGVELHWTERGTGTALIILHGLADSQHTWGTVAARLASRYRVFCLDLPGCGLSGRPNADYTLAWQARLTACWLDGIGMGSCDVLGHSYGGGVALWLLLYRASSMRKLALVAPGGLGQEVAPWLRLAATLGICEAGGQWLIGPITRLLVHRYGRSLTVSERQGLWRMNCSPGAGRAFVRTVRDVVNWRGQTRQLLARIAEIQPLPSIGLFWGERDRVVPIAQGEALCRQLENCSLWRLPGAGHFLHWQAPEWLASALLDYLDSPLTRCSRLERASTGTALGVDSSSN